MPQNVSEILDQVLFLYEGYSKEHRATTQPFHLAKVQAPLHDMEPISQNPSHRSTNKT